MAIKEALRGIAYQSGLFSLIHRWRNRHSLTVFMFHRVLPKDSPEYAAAEKEFTFSVEGFGACLDFINRHYNVVSNDAVKQHLQGKSRLPARAGLITFDDGWRDTALYALPELRKRELPAVLFLATEVLELTEDRWWQDALVEVLLQDNGLETIEAALNLQPGTVRSERQRRVTATLAALPADQRSRLLDPYVTYQPVSRQMLSKADPPLLSPLVQLAGHGHCHAPLSNHTQPGADLKACHDRLRALGGDPETLSFPHGAFNPKVFKLARQAGFTLCYSSEPELSDTHARTLSNQPLGRIHIPENQWTCDGQAISPARLATFLFFRPIAA